MKEASRTRIAFIVPSFPKLTEPSIVSKFLGLLDRGWDVFVVCVNSDPVEWSKFSELQGRKDARARVYTVWPRQPHWLALLLLPVALVHCLVRNPAGVARYLRRGWRHFGLDVLRRLYRDHRLVCLCPNVVHFVFGTLAVEQIYVRELLGYKVVVSFRGYDLNFSGLDTPDYFQEVWKEADALHLLGKDLWWRAQLRGCPPNKLHMLIPPAIDPAFFDPTDRVHAEVVGTPERPLRILSVGRIEWKKGYDYALQTARLLLDRGISCEYQIIGDGSYLEAVAFARHQLGLEDVVQLIGALPRAQVRDRMRWPDVFLHPAVSEGFCNAVMEAQAMQLPIVCSDADGLSENVRDGETGFVVPRRDVSALAEKLTLLAQDRQLRERMGRAGRQRVLAHFRVRDQIAAFECLYRQILTP